MFYQVDQPKTPYIPNHLRIALIIFSTLLLTAFLGQISPQYALNKVGKTPVIKSASHHEENKVTEESQKNNSDKYAVQQIRTVSIKQERYMATPTPVVKKQAAFDVLPAADAQDTPTSSPWGKSRQIDEHTWTIKVENDSRSGTAQEILTALNAYRQKKGKGSLAWDSGLANYAQSRAESFSAAHTLDGHAGFMDFINNQDGFHKLGFYGLGENSSYGYSLEAVHLIEWVYAGDAPHDNNQLSSEWTHVGIGVSGSATDLVFGGPKM